MRSIVVLLIVVGLILILFWQYLNIGRFFLLNNYYPNENLNINKDGIHIGIIPDGNRRWLKENNKTSDDILKRWKMMEMLFDIDLIKTKILRLNKNPDLLEYVNKINEISVYVLSIENLKRKDSSLEMVYKFIKKISKLDLHDMNINIIGKIDLLPFPVKKNIEKIVKKSNIKGKYTLNIAVSYDPVEDMKNFGINNRKQTQIDLVIRSGREKRSSGFFPCHTLYSEWYFSDKLWPDMSELDILKSLEYYSKKNRRFGK